MCLHVSQLSSRNLGHRSSNRAEEAAGVNASGAVRRAHTHVHKHTHHLDSISTCWLAHNHHPFFSLTPRTLSKDPGAFPSPNQVAVRKEEEKKENCVSNKSPPLSQRTQLITFAREEACPAQLWLSPLPSNNHDLHALPVRPLLLPATGRERDGLRERKREREREREKSNKRPQMGVGQHSWRTEEQRAFHIPSLLMMTSVTWEIGWQMSVQNINARFCSSNVQSWKMSDTAGLCESVYSRGCVRQSAHILNQHTLGLRWRTKNNI